MIIYDGPSTLTGEPIIAVATGFADGPSRNAKTGAMVQTYILLRDRSPVDAAHDGGDAAVCGDCVHRGVPGVRRRSCYVNVNWAALNIWRKALAGGYPPLDAEAFYRQLVRVGAYGDPAAVPVEVWDRVTAWARGWTGYTHAWPDPRFASLKRVCMASVDSVEEAARAQSMGWRTFRVRRAGEELQPGQDGAREVVCPASEEGRKRTTCAACRVCDGRSRRRGPHVAILAHGPNAGIFETQRRQLPLFSAPSVLLGE